METLSNEITAVFDQLVTCEPNQMELAYLLTLACGNAYNPELIEQYLMRKMEADRLFDIHELSRKMNEAVTTIKKSVKKFFKSEEALAFYKEQGDLVAAKYGMEISMGVDSWHSYSWGEFNIVFNAVIPTLDYKGKLMTFDYKLMGHANFDNLDLDGASGRMDKDGLPYKQLCLQKELLEYYMANDFVQQYAKRNFVESDHLVKMYKFCTELSKVLSKVKGRVHSYIKHYHYDKVMAAGVFPYTFKSNDKKVDYVTIKGVQQGSNGLNYIAADIICKCTKKYSVKTKKKEKRYGRTVWVSVWTTAYKKWRKDKSYSRKPEITFKEEIFDYL